ncbi:MAG: zinc ribbon domain-containing protein [Lachnospiraceae bacterium]|nr:zinc ribbon domain-containing protein [Lachnospiraceae bacterium]
MKCPNCNAEVTGKFCSYCGSEMPKEQTTTTFNGNVVINNYYGKYQDQEPANIYDKPENNYAQAESEMKCNEKNIATIWIILSFIFIYPLGIWLIAYKKNQLNSIWFTVVSLIFFYPMGLISMWYYKQFNKTARIILTVIFGIMTVSAYIN